jgi:hypothetical protein
MFENAVINKLEADVKTSFSHICGEGGKERAEGACINSLIAELATASGCR